ncbi:hypothetical protein SAMN05421690_100347 [Nitrosomonas sp. Nm51]|nr:hypothetical protein SAMN05421690_100347 [Nitrosomonas sp. Nm51]
MIEVLLTGSSNKANNENAADTYSQSRDIWKISLNKPVTDWTDTVAPVSRTDGYPHQSKKAIIQLRTRFRK